MKALALKLLAGTLAVALVLVAPTAASSAKKKKSKKAESTEGGSVSEGEAIFKKNCNMCHYPNKADKKLGPGLRDLFKNKELPESHRPATEENVRAQIEKGSPDAKPMPMPAFAEKLTPEEMENLLAYLKIL